MSVARNDPCPCGSGKKYKKCCLGDASAAKRVHTQRALTLGSVLLAIAALVFFFVDPYGGKVMAGLAVVAVGAYLMFADPPASKGGGSPGAINFGR